MPFCPTGQHPEQKPGFGTAISLTAGAIGGLFSDAGLPWAVAIGAAIGAVSYDLQTMCNSDPPAPPTITADDVAALLAGPLIATPDYFAALSKFYDLTRAWAWFKFCQCSGGTTPAPPTPQPTPTGMPNVNPVSAPAAGPCKTWNYNGANVTGTGSLARSAFPVNDIPVTMVKVTVTNTAVSGGGLTVKFTFQWDNELVSPIVTGQTYAQNIPPGLTFSFIIPYEPGYTNLFHRLDGLGGAGVSLCSATAEAYCGASSPTISPTPCAADPAILQVLDRIDKMTQLIQRQAVPFGSIDGPAHSGLTGSGHFDISDPLMGIRINLTTTPDRVGVREGDPDTLWDVGEVALGDADDWFGHRLINHDGLLWQPRWAGMVTRVGYSLLPGVIATITELEREP